MEKKYVWTEEDYEMDAENHEARKYYTESGCRALMAAVCLHAVKDYKSTPSKIVKEELENFFDDWMFQYFVDGMEVPDIVKTIERAPKKIHYVNILPEGAVQYISEDAKYNKKARYHVMKDGQFIAGYQTMKSARRIADICDGAVYDGGKEIYSKTLHLKGW